MKERLYPQKIEKGDLKNLFISCLSKKRTKKGCPPAFLNVIFLQSFGEAANSAFGFKQLLLFSSFACQIPKKQKGGFKKMKSYLVGEPAIFAN